MACRGRDALAVRVLTVPLAIVCLLAQISSAAHLAIAPHTICPEHGEVVDAEGRTHGRTADASVVAKRTQLDDGRDAEPTAHRHDHCLLASERRERAVLLPPAHGVAPATGAASTRGRLSPVPPPAPIDLIFLAPKSSPPSA